MIEQALEIAARMLGQTAPTDISPELICADFLAGAGLHLGDEHDILLLDWSEYFTCRPVNSDI